MKNCITTLVLLMCSHIALFAQKLQQTDLNMSVGDILPLTGVNTADLAECYSFLTPDGLHLYYTKSVETSDAIWFAERKSPDAAFTDKGPIVQLENTYDQLSCWVSADELQLFFVARGAKDSLFVATRNTVGEPFTEAAPITLEAEIEITMICTVSLTPDGKQLFATVNAREYYAFMQFELKSGNTFSHTQTLPLPAGSDLHVSTGKLSSDGLHFYTVLVRGENGKKAPTYQVARYVRKSLSEDFTQLEVLNKPQRQRIHQPCETSDENVLLCTYNTEDSWYDNDLVFVRLQGPANPGKKPRKKGRQ